ncbi:flagellar hook-length control protein FliK [Polynucleobacter sp. CS-Odin-A6]|uniref:flagellar hook-length control protein FliK n=1 Tax=Polynucleobacter sp. CS-Odin-A6 TaxID=2689106 RepID=UPI001C0B24EE|nr:flagellar hook-length control protein FliK [Polynucleobacter sp. CS-Odin-A6]MBU3621848.1 flagellar hook-length control protein FliK [Polynucleobacter sp. CS-Odin-A6]
MNIDVKAQAQSLLNMNVAQEPTLSSSQSTGIANAPIFGQMLSTQVKVLQVQDAKNTVDTAQLLSPKFEHASKTEAKAKSHAANHPGQAHHLGEWVNLGGSNLTARTQLSVNIQNLHPGSHAEFAFAKLAEMQAQAKNMRLFSNDALSNSSNSDVKAEFSMPHTRLPNTMGVLGKTGLLGDSEKEANHSKIAPNPDSEVITAVGVTGIEHQSQEQNGQGHGDHPEADLGSAQLRTNTMQGQIHASFGSLQWSEEISQKLVLMIDANMHSAVLNLNPENLGPLKIVISVQDHLVNSTFISNNEEVRQVLRDGVETLRASMKESGLDLIQADVRSGKSFQQSQEQVLATLLPEDQVELAQALSNQSQEARTLLSDGTVNVFV